MMQINLITTFTIICQKTQNNSQFNTCTKNGSDSGDTQQQQEKVLRSPKKSAFIVGDSMIKK